MTDRVRVAVDGRELSLSNLEKVLYPAVGFTKGQVLDYYTRIAPVLLPHLAGRALTRLRFPDGVEGGSFFEKNAPSHTPAWVRRVTLPSPGSSRGTEEISYVVADELATLVWLAQLGVLELHTPMWRALPAAADPDLLVLDLDPGPPATIVECCQVACVLRDLLRADGLAPVPKTSGSKGLQLYAPVAGASARQTSAYAQQLAQRLEREHPAYVVSRMTKALRPGKVLVDWSQNNAAKTTVTVYSLRARPEPTVSTPVTWEEVDGVRAPEDLRFTAADVLARVEADGDLFAPVLVSGPPLPATG